MAIITPYLYILKRKLLLNAFFKAQFISVLVTEMFKLDKKMSTELMQGTFCVRQTRIILEISIIYHGSERISNLGPIIWNLVPDRLKEINSISSLKNNGSLNSVLQSHFFRYY